VAAPFSVFAISRAAGQEVAEPVRSVGGPLGDERFRAGRRIAAPRSLSKCTADPTPIRMYIRRDAAALRASIAAAVAAFPRAWERLDRIDLSISPWNSHS